MKFATFVEGSRHRIGAVDVDASCVRPLALTVHDIIDLIERYDEVGRLGPVDGPGIPLDQIRLLARSSRGATSSASARTTTSMRRSSHGAATRPVL